MLKFNELKTSHPFYFLVKGDTLEFCQGTVITVSQPYFPNLTQSPNYTNRIIDITVKQGNETKTYTVNENSTVSETPGGTVISADKEGIIHELEAIKLRAEEELKKVDQNKSYLESSEAILEQLNPTLAERKEQEKRIRSLEEGFGDMRELLKDISTTLKDLKK